MNWQRRECCTPHCSGCTIRCFIAFSVWYMSTWRSCLKVERRSGGSFLMKSPTWSRYRATSSSWSARRLMMASLLDRASSKVASLSAFRASRTASIDSSVGPAARRFLFLFPEPWSVLGPCGGGSAADEGPGGGGTIGAEGPCGGGSAADERPGGGGTIGAEGPGRGVAGRGGGAVEDGHGGGGGWYGGRGVSSRLLQLPKSSLFMVENSSIN